MTILGQMRSIIGPIAGYRCNTNVNPVIPPEEGRKVVVIDMYAVFFVPLQAKKWTNLYTYVDHLKVMTS